MRKLKLFFAFMLMSVLSIGQVWGAEELKATIDFSSNDFSIPTSKTVAENTYTHDGISMTLTGTSGNGYAYYSKDKYLLNGKQGATITFSAFEWKTTKIVVTGRSGASGSTKMNIFVGENAVSTETTGSTGTNTYNIASTSQAAGTIYTLKVTSAHNAQFTKFEIYGEDAGTPAKTLTSIAVSGAPTKTAYYAGDEFDPAGLVVTGTYSDQSQATISSGITWSYNPSQTLALNQTSIGVTATVNSIASAEYPVSITVAAAPAADNYELVTSVASLAAGDKIIIVNADATKAISTTQNNNNRGAADVTATNDVITPGDAVQVLTLGITNEHWTLYTGAGYLYAASSSSNNMKTQTTNNANGEWTISIANDGTATIVAQGSYTRNTMQYNSGSTIFSCYGSASQTALKIFKKVDGTVKPSAELSYAAADQKKLTKLGETFTAPTLVNPHGVAVTYASSAESVAEVASNGAVTIKAVGVAEITASFAGNDDYKAGSASYTIGVTTHAGTEADPYVAADAKIAIDAMGTVENAYATGLVSNVVTSTLPQEGYISFYFSADGNTTGQQIEAYKCYGLNSAPFEAVTDVKTGATVVVTGTLKKYNNTYEFDQNCHLVSYEAPAVPKTHIANDQANPYTVAQAITYAADGVTYDLDDYVYVQGVVYDVKSFSNGAMNIFIKDANTENQFELYKCAGINDGNTTTPFEALTDVQAGNIVIGYGQLTVYNTTFEFKQGNYLVDLQKPVTGIELDATAEVEEESTVNLTATILPSNATGTIAWSVTSGSEYASVADGVVTGIAEGEAVIRATVQGTEIYAECTVTVTEKSAPASYDYALVTDAAQLQDGLKVIIVAAEADKAAGSAAATYRNVVDVERTTGGEYLILDTENMPTEFTLGVPAAGQYTFNDGDGYMYESGAKSVKVRTDPFNWSITIGNGNIATIQATNELRYNSSSPRFTTYASGQQALQLYVKDDGKQAAGLAWNPAEDIEITVGDAFTAPSLTNPNGLTVTIASDNTELATVENNVVSLVANVTGTAKITASFGGDDTYRAASVSYTITVSAAPQPAGTANVVIIAEYDSKFYALTNSISNKTAAAIEITKDGDNIIVPSVEAKAAIQWTRTTDGENTTFQDADDKYLKGVSNSGDLTLADDACNWGWNATDEYYFIGSRSFIYREGADGFKNYSTQNAGTQDYSNIAEVRVIDPENIVVVVPTTHTVSYNANGGTLISGEDPIADAQVAEGATVTVAANVYEKEDYMFAGWLYGETVYQAGQTFGMPTEDVELVAQWNPVSVSDYVLVTDVAQLKAGDKVIIVAADYNIAAGSAAATYRSTVEIAKTSDKSHLIFGASMPTEFTLGIMEDGYAFADVNGYMYESAAKSVKTQAEPFAWTISIDAEAIATISADNELRYNSTSPRFTTYESGQKALQLYRKPSEFVEARNGLSAGRYYTICMEKNIMAVKNASFWSLTYKDAEQATEVYLVEETAPLVAGKPYIFQAGAATLDVIYGDKVVAAPIENGALRGTFTVIDAEAFAALTEDPYLLIENMLRPRTDGNYLNDHRAYVAFEALTVPETPNFAPGKRVRAIPMQPQVATGVDALNATEAPVKMIINGQLFILRGEKMYNVNGQLVK